MLSTALLANAKMSNYSAVKSQCLSKQPGVTIGKKAAPGSLDESNLGQLTSVTGSITGSHRIRSIKLCKSKKNILQ